MDEKKGKLPKWKNRRRPGDAGNNMRGQKELAAEKKIRKQLAEISQIGAAAREEVAKGKLAAESIKDAGDTRYDPVVKPALDEAIEACKAIGFIFDQARKSVSIAVADQFVQAAKNKKLELSELLARVNNIKASIDQERERREARAYAEARFATIARKYVVPKDAVSIAAERIGDFADLFMTWHGEGKISLDNIGAIKEVFKKNGVDVRQTEMPISKLHRIEEELGKIAYRPHWATDVNVTVFATAVCLLGDAKEIEQGDSE